MNFTNNEHLNLKVNYVSLMFSLRLTFYRLQSDIHVAKVYRMGFLRLLRKLGQNSCRIRI